MLVGIAVVMLSGLILGRLMKKAGLPPLVGMIIAGIALGPHALGVINGEVMALSSELRRAALVIILTRAGLALDIDDLKKAGRPALLMCFVPAVCEIAATAILAPFIFGISLTDALVLGSVLAAVSPAVVVPRMIRLMDEKYGTDKKIPQLILAGASADDILVVVLFSVFSSMAAGSGGSVASQLVGVPLSIITGTAAGIILGLLMKLIFEKVRMRDTVKTAVTLSVSFLLVGYESLISQYVSFSALIAITAMGITIKKTAPERAVRLSSKYNKLWAAAEVVLFVLVGAEVSISDAFTFGVGAVILVLLALVFRMAGVFLSVCGTKLNGKEKLFCMLAYTPKATVQAAIGAVPLAMGLSCGRLALTCAVLSILITAPMGAFLIDRTYKSLLSSEDSAS
ncbi:MAG: cation:proton antiporter [Huintestinicola sp.]